MFVFEDFWQCGGKVVEFVDFDEIVEFGGNEEYLIFLLWWVLWVQQ